MTAHNRLPSFLAFASIAIVTGLSGCGMGSTGREVSGAVTLDGSPLKSGRITFEPRSAGKMAVGSITEGTYRIPAEQAPTAGSYLVRITAERPTGRKPTTASRSLEDQGAEQQQYEQYLPAKYNSRSELTVEITDASDGKFDFELISK